MTQLRALAAIGVLALTVTACGAGGSEASPGPTSGMPSMTTAAASAPSSPSSVSSVSSASSAPAEQVRAARFTGLPFVGPLFPHGTGKAHSCVATVVASRSGDTIVTAAHCLHGTERGVLFAPGYRAGVMPYGAWRITGAQADVAWLHRHDPQHDVTAFTVADRTVDGHLRTLQQVVGAAALGTAVRSGTSVSIVGYDGGSGDLARRCTDAVSSTSGFPTLRCGGFGSGSSGSPWLVPAGRPTTLVGVIGGLHNGGCTRATSYSPAFGAQARAVVAAAAAGRRGVTETPGGGNDGC